MRPGWPPGRQRRYLSGKRYGKATLAGGFFCLGADRGFPAVLLEQDQADHLHVVGAVVVDGMPFAVGTDGRVPGMEHDLGAVVVIAALALEDVVDLHVAHMLVTACLLYTSPSPRD